LNNLTDLKYLDLSYNKIESISNQDGTQLKLTNLEEFNLSDNLFRNNTISFLEGLSSLKSLDMSWNNLQGSLDIKDGTQLRLTNLEELDLSDNLFCNNTVSSLEGLSSLKSLDMSSNSLEGSLDIKDGGRKLELTHLEKLHLGRNYFNTSVFASLNKLSNLKYLSIYENKLKGSIDMKGI
ncbi:hypothetical protein J1N35_013129, partial [Gossypium stocksii]